MNVLQSVDFDNTQLAFQAKTDAQLRRTYWLYRMVDSPFLTKVGPPILMTAFKLQLPIEGMVRNSLFELFCGGISLKDTIKTSQMLFNYKVYTILDYSVEGEKNEAGFDTTMAEIIDALKHGGGMQEVAFSACKLTGLASIDLLEKVQKRESLDEAESQAFERFRKRVDQICATAAAQCTPIFIDAEESWIQDPIDQLAEEMMEKYNHDQMAVYTTVQLYRTDRLGYLEGLIQQSKKKGYLLGVKLVRGAYIEKERERAKNMGYEDPMQPNKETTDQDFDAALKLCVEHIEHVGICAGTHNEKSSRYLAQLMQLKGVANDHSHICFAQLLGMSDHISFNLAHAGYRVAKYLPYGPVKAVMPYLIRRAKENTAIAGQSSREVELLHKEIDRRKSL